jgi:hypothetical protein
VVCPNSVPQNSAPRIASGTKDCGFSRHNATQSHVKRISGPVHKKTW